VNDYPGSPALAQQLLPASTRMIFFEKHPTEHKELVKALGE
jgi:23S rRNA (adenine2030-N6)-methyltransferase